MNKKLSILLVVGLLLTLVVAACANNRDDDVGSWYAGRAEVRETMGVPTLNNLSRSRAVSEEEIFFALADAAPQSAPMAPPPQAPGNTSGGAGDVTWEDIYGQNERHVIRSASLEMYSEDFDATVDALRVVAPAVNGYIESEVLTGTGRRRLTIVLRVPVAAFDYALRQVSALGTVTHQHQSAEDVTSQFYDLAGNLETRRIEEERILSLIERADDIHELLALEARLSNVRQTIASYLTQLNQMAGRVSYSTLTVTLTEDAPPVVPAGLTLGERIGGAFGDSVDGTVNVFQGIVVFLAGAVIPLALLAIVGLVIWTVIKSAKKRAVHPQS